MKILLITSQAFNPFADIIQLTVRIKITSDKEKKIENSEESTGSDRSDPATIVKGKLVGLIPSLWDPSWDHREMRNDSKPARRFLVPEFFLRSRRFVGNPGNPLIGNFIDRMLAS